MARLTTIVACGVILQSGCGPRLYTRTHDAQGYLDAKARHVRRAKSDFSRSYVLGAMHDLEMRLRTLIGPLDLDGRASAYNPLWLTRNGTEGGELDAIRFGDLSADTIILVTTRELASAWLQAEGDTARDPLVALARPEHVLWEISFNAHAYQYVDIDAIASVPSGVRAARLISHSQDDIPITPRELLIVAEYGDLVFVVLAPAASLTTPVECSGSISSGQGDWRYVTQANEQVYLACFDRVVPKQSQFQQVTAQVESFAKLLRQAAGR